MRTTTFVGVFVLSLAFTLMAEQPTKAISDNVLNSPLQVLEGPLGAATSFDELALEQDELVEILEEIELESDEPIALEANQESRAEEQVQEEKENTVHSVILGDTLANIAEQYDTDWKRVFYKNEALTNPDVLIVGTELIIPGENEELEIRDIVVPEPVAPAPLVTTQSTSTQTNTTVAYTPPANTSGNTYYYGYCTWYAKNMRPDLPNNLGNADTWAARAAAQGYATGSTPQVGAIGQQGMHVVYVEKVHANGTVTISEMNFQGWNVVSSRTVPSSSFTYIY